MVSGTRERQDLATNRWDSPPLTAITRDFHAVARALRQSLRRNSACRAHTRKQLPPPDTPLPRPGRVQSETMAVTQLKMYFECILC